MTFIQTPYISGDVFAQRYRFPRRGDGIPMHEHATELAHNVIVLRGSVEIYGPGKAWSRTLHAGGVFDLDDPLLEHEILALEDGSETMHVYLYGMPEAYKRLPESELGGIVNRPITIPL